MEQSVYYVNCPSCGKIVEVICPIIGKVPKKVLAYDDTSLLALDELTTIRCACGESLKVTWVF